MNCALLSLAAPGLVSGYALLFIFAIAAGMAVAVEAPHDR
jgi:hypothetical protein